MDQINAPANTATAFLARQDMLGLPFMHNSAVDGVACACGGCNGVVVTVMGEHPLVRRDMQNNLMLTLFQHDRLVNDVACALTVEAARQLCNQLGGAIAAIETRMGRADDPIRKLLED